MWYKHHALPMSNRLWCSWRLLIEEVEKRIRLLHRSPWLKWKFQGFLSTFDMDKLGKIHRLRWKEQCVKISTTFKFKGNLLNTNEDANQSINQSFINSAGHKLTVQILTTKDCKGPQTNMPKNVGSIKTWSAKMKSRHIKFCKENTAMLIVLRKNKL